MAGSTTKQFNFIINSAKHAISKKCDLKLPRSTAFNYFVAESITGPSKERRQFEIALFRDGVRSRINNKIKLLVIDPATATCA